MKCGIRPDLGVVCALVAAEHFATAEIRHTRVFVSTVNEWREKEKSGDTTRQAIQCSQTQYVRSHCVDWRWIEPIICASRSMRLPSRGVCACSFARWFCIRDHIRFRGAHSIFFGGRYAAADVAHSKQKQMASLMRAASVREKRAWIEESQRSNIQLFYIRKDSVSKRRTATISCSTLPSPAHLDETKRKKINRIALAEPRKIAAMAFGLLLCHFISVNSLRAFTHCARTHKHIEPPTIWSKMLHFFGIDGKDDEKGGKRRFSLKKHFILWWRHTNGFASTDCYRSSHKIPNTACNVTTTNGRSRENMMWFQLVVGGMWMNRQR